MINQFVARFLYQVVGLARLVGSRGARVYGRCGDGSKERVDVRGSGALAVGYGVSWSMSGIDGRVGGWEGFGNDASALDENRVDCPIGGGYHRRKLGKSRNGRRGRRYRLPPRRAIVIGPMNGHFMYVSCVRESYPPGGRDGRRGCYSCTPYVQRLGVKIC